MLEREPSPISAAHTPRQQRGVLDKGARTGVQERKPGYTQGEGNRFMTMLPGVPTVAQWVKNQT